MVQKLSHKIDCEDCGKECMIGSKKLVEYSMAKKVNSRAKFVCPDCHFYYKFSTVVVDHVTGETKTYMGIFPDNFKNYRR